MKSRRLKTLKIKVSIVFEVALLEVAFQLFETGHDCDRPAVIHYSLFITTTIIIIIIIIDFIIIIILYH